MNSVAALSRHSTHLDTPTLSEGFRTPFQPIGRSANPTDSQDLEGSGHSPACGRVARNDGQSVVWSSFLDVTEPKRLLARRRIDPLADGPSKMKRSVIVELAGECRSRSSRQPAFRRFKPNMKRILSLPHRHLNLMAEASISVEFATPLRNRT